MSLILKNSAAFPVFKHQDTLAFHRKEQPSRTTKRFHTVTPIRHLISQSTRPINLTHQGESAFERSPKDKQKITLTPRPTHKKDPSLQGYLEHLNSVRIFRSPLVGDATIKKIKEEVELFQTESQTTLQRFKSLKEQGDKRKKISLLETVRNPQAQQYKRFTEQLYNLIHNLHLLKDYLNNSRKLFQVVKNQIGIRKNLYRILINPQNEELYEFSEISRLCCIRDVQFVNGESRVIEKFDLSLLDDLIYMTDSIKQLLQQNQLKAIERMRDNIKVEQYEINKLRGQLGMREESHQLSIGSTAMKRFKPHLELDNIESRLGQLNQIPKQARWTSQLLCDIVDRLNE
ncbi:unnamed protein product [Paramecium sonneborni]|uniref:Uncharacterized protein n=1 Tax=Paramecium sonneborni TaxID=65129 RepID=A0A8S1M5L9_9CILI|nr:unnamed protein product [Paramecium sonneborni]CAD8074102.1 unnamed protein product [Paramecium sonneborni]